jgi:molybdopterin synthase sulfur carrier subunit
MIRTRVKLFASLRRYFPGLGIGEAMEVELPDGATVREMLRHLRLPPDQVKVVFVNGIASTEERVLSDGDELGIFPPVGGG